MTIHERDDAAEDEDDPETRVIKAHVAQLAEHFDTVQVLVARKDPDGTTPYDWGAGNWYARYGQVKAWVVREEETLRRETRTASDE